ncbi:acyl-CoA dehydrogenase family protein [Mycolicibacterium confluentis]|uniref:Acyl-CoA dehydrogenase n=1 Tax=Mycolicibacterium confluentis TaxID=28047 RepID=A0A7I7Y3Z1_9MYCO|nr:acyl-CoA dehydrogenase [Mycolicibacterium confluentis]MCV7322742.1 acyl-CoA dehydrogenase [Mycolicibacterium confluentis]ORV29733.1 hypothetical protein AWB99_16265 [Mycolicibacterium confluentis]BBZ36356.1 acyl-CoA dehydrogenase [Mycolicibacterium confluentis]
MTDKDAAFEATFAEYLREVQVDTVGRENRRELPRRQIRDLLGIGFGTLRLLQEWGGLGWDLARTFGAVIDLAAADPHIAHAFRGHFNFIEDSRVAAPHHHPELIAALASGDFVGTAYSERALTPAQQASVVQRGNTLYLSGVKYYSTGSLYADWIVTAGCDRDTGQQLNVIVNAHDPGVDIIDDWDGFGQKLTGSGTTRFTDVPVAFRNHVGDESELAPDHAFQTAFLQLYLLAAVAGISASVVRDAVAYVQPRQRTFGVGAVAEPRRNPLVQETVGELHGIALSVRSIILEEARQLDAVQALLRDSGVDGERKLRAAQHSLVRVYSIQSLVLDLALRGATRLFDVGGASATSVELALDRHWRNIRTIGTHNPADQRLQQVGNHLLNDVTLSPLGRLGPTEIGLVTVPSVQPTLRETAR